MGSLIPNGDFSSSKDHISQLAGQKVMKTFLYKPVGKIAIMEKKLKKYRTVQEFPDE
jgi:hypothetical protein